METCWSDIQPNKRPKVWWLEGEGGREGGGEVLMFSVSAGLPYWLPAVAGRKKRSSSSDLETGDLVDQP